MNNPTIRRDRMTNAGFGQAGRTRSTVACVLTTALRRGFLGLAVLALAACATIYRDHGYVPIDRQLDEVVVGVDTRDSVIETLGRPSTGGILDDGGYYYVASRFRHWAWTKPKEVERQVVAITFDDKGVVRNVERFGLEGGRVVALSRRITDTKLASPTFLGQLFGNFGNVTAADVVN